MQVGMISMTYQLTASLLQPLVGLYTDKRPLPFSLPTGMVFTLVGLLAICVKLLAAAQEQVTWLHWVPTQWGKVGAAIGISENSALGMLLFAGLAYSLFHFARKPLETGPVVESRPGAQAH